MVSALPKPRSETKAAVTVTQQSAICAASRTSRRAQRRPAEDAPAARSNGHADGNLASAVCGASCEQAAEVGAGGEQHNAGQHHHRSQKSARRPAHKVTDQARTSQLQCQTLFLLRILPGN